LAAPVIFNITSNPGLGKPLGFDFTDYLHQYFAAHFLINSITPMGLLVLGALTITAAVALVRLGPSAVPLQAAFTGAVMVYAVGALLPYVTHNPRLLELHLLRSSTTIHLIAAVALAGLATRWMCDGDNRALFFPGCLLALALCALQLSFVLCIPIIMTANLLRSGERFTLNLGYVLLAFLAAVIWPLAIRHHQSTNRQYAEGSDEWLQIGRWALAATPAGAIFLTPVGDVNASPSGENNKLRPSTGSAAFEFASHRRVWVDFRRGAAVMWTPSYYPIWRGRVTEVTHLDTFDERLAYAQRNKISYIVDSCDAATSRQEAVFRTQRLCVFTSSLPRETVKPLAPDATRNAADSERPGSRSDRP
jgi:hypothetical protein